VKDLVAELLVVRPDAAATTLGGHEVFRVRDETPAHRFESVIKRLDGSRLIELTARDSFDARLAKFLLDRAAEVELPTRGSVTIRVFPIRFPARWTFECVVVAPPRVAKRFEHESVSLRRATYWVVPAFQGEFDDRAGGDAFWHQLGRKDGWRSVVVRWDRSRKTRPVFDA
jgi:hypothetical protein